MFSYRIHAQDQTMALANMDFLQLFCLLCVSFIILHFYCFFRAYTRAEKRCTQKDLRKIASRRASLSLFGVSLVMLLIVMFFTATILTSFFTWTFTDAIIDRNEHQDLFHHYTTSYLFFLLAVVVLSIMLSFTHSCLWLFFTIKVPSITVVSKVHIFIKFTLDT